jgi:hypothetical protein
MVDQTLPWEGDTSWFIHISAPSDLDLNARWVELSATGGVLRIEGVGLMERDDLNTEDVLSWGQTRGNGNVIL